MNSGNIYDQIPKDLSSEVFEKLAGKGQVTIERIISKGQTSPESGWYDQQQNEWVIVLKGAATLTFEDGAEVHLSSGEYLDIPAHTKHKVSWTDPEVETIWLAVHY